MNKLSSKEDYCLRWLSDKMEATAFMVGRAIWDHGFNQGGSYLPGLGAAVLGSLRKKGLVMRLPELNAWRLSKEGRDYVSKR